MPWDAILGGATGAAAAIIVLGTLFAKSVLDKLLNVADRRFASTLKQAEETHRLALATASTIDTDLRARRINVYTELWEKTGKLPQWPRNPDLTYSDLKELTEHLCLWYFKSGGMYLSTRAREAYGEVQETLASVLKKAGDGNVRDLDYELIRGKCSTLRTELTRDLLSRREAPEVPGD